MNGYEKIWQRYGMNRRQFLKNFGIAAGALTFSPYFFNRLDKVFAHVDTTKVYLVKNGDFGENTIKLCELINLTTRINPSDVVVIKGNAQWPNQGYTHTGVIKYVIDEILKIPEFSGEIFICDNVQTYGTDGKFGFDVGESFRKHNWEKHNWNSLAAEYQSLGKPVAVKRWYNTDKNISGPADGEGWIRDFFIFYGEKSFLSYPVFESPLTHGRMIDMKKGVWENGIYTGRKVKTIFIPNLNNHGYGSEDYAGITSAIKSFFGATEIPGGGSGIFRGYRNIHCSSFADQNALYAGKLVARFINKMYSPDLYITSAIWSGHHSRTGNAVETKTVLGCENPVTLDYVAARDVISPHAHFLNPDLNNNTRKQILGCLNSGIGTIDPKRFEVIVYDFDNPVINRFDIDKKIKEHKEGKISEQEVKEAINQYMESK